EYAETGRSRWVGSGFRWAARFLHSKRRQYPCHSRGHAKRARRSGGGSHCRHAQPPKRSPILSRRADGYTRASEGGSEMTRTTAIRIGFLAAALSWAAGAPAQDLTITNARILDGDGSVIEQGSLIVRDGRIAEIVRGQARQSVGRTIDAGGRTVMPGFIDSHRHIIRGDGDEWLRSHA